MDPNKIKKNAEILKADRPEFLEAKREAAVANILNYEKAVVQWKRFLTMVEAKINSRTKRASGQSKKGPY
jgi:hypothetical protein